MSDHQPVTPELRAWIIEQATAGHPPDVALKSMLASGWNEDSAVTALEATLTSYLGEKQAERANVPPPVSVPEPLPQGARTSVWAGDREVGIVVSMFNPRIVVFSGLLSDEECDEIVALARARLARSETVQTDRKSVG